MTPAMTTTSDDTLDRLSAATPAGRDRRRPSPADRPTGSGVERPSLVATGILLLGLLGFVLSVLFQLVERRALGWYHGLRAAARRPG